MQRRDLLLSILMLAVGVPYGMGQVVQAQAPEVRNIQSAQEGEAVTITYDLRGEKGETYTVRFLLSTDGGEIYDVEPQAVSGAVGPGVAPGASKRITWRVRKDFPEGLPGAVQYRIVVEGGDGAPSNEATVTIQVNEP